VLSLPTDGGPVPLLLRLVLPPDGRPPVVVLTELAGAPVPWTDRRFVGLVADEVTTRFGAQLQAPSDRILWFADHAADDGPVGLLRRLEVLRDGARHLADPRHSEALPADAAAWWRSVLQLRAADDVLAVVQPGSGSPAAQRSASATASDRSR
jgi:hypothetical protein